MLKYIFYRIKEIRKNKRRIQFVKEVLPKHSIGAEIGVHKGRFTPILFKITKPQKLHLIDPWWLKGEQWEWDLGNRSTSDAVINIIKKFKSELANQTISLEIGNDLEILTIFPDQYFDWIYLDTTHSYEQTKEELSLLKCKVKSEGVIAGDDWRTDSTHRHHGVYKAIQEFIKQEPYYLIYANENNLQWAIRKTT